MKNLNIAGLAAAAICGIFSQGCANKSAVITNTETVLGIVIAENPANQLYHVKFGYARSETAFVPSNLGATSKGTNMIAYKGGATDVADVIMELEFRNIFKGGGLYQRLAVGSVAVAQPGAALMFAKDSDGALGVSSAAAIAAVKGLPAQDLAITSMLVPVAQQYKASNRKTEFDTAVQKYGYATFIQFALDSKLTKDTFSKAAADLKSLGLIQ